MLPTPAAAPTVSRPGGFFEWVEGAPAEGYRSERAGARPIAGDAGVGSTRGDRPGWSPASSAARVLDAAGARLAEVAGRAGRGCSRWRTASSAGNIGVTGLLTGADVADALDAADPGVRVLLPDVVLSNGRFLDGTTLDDLPVPSRSWPPTARHSCVPSPHVSAARA